MQHRDIFTAKYLREVGKQFELERDVPQLAAVRQHVADWQTSFHNGTIIRQSEIQLQKEFLNTFLVGCLGYRGKIGRNDWEIDYEQTTEVDSTRADGYLGFFNPNGRKTVAVIELKDANTDLDRPQNRKNDKRTPVEQAFSYVSKVGGDCRWVIVSNFVEIRLYHAQDQGRYEYFHITQLDKDEQLWRFLFLLHRDRLLPHGAESYLEHYHRQRLEQEQTISIDFYKKFKDYRQRLFQHLKIQNPEHPDLLLFEKTQKLLDRLVFVFFCEDKGLLPVDMTRKVKQAAHASLDPAEGQGLWTQLKNLFRSIDKGNPAQNINRYNGGLFAHDPALDELRLDDSMAEVLLGLSNYDYDSDLNVNILGHIFEQSISDIEEMKAEIAGVVTEKKQGKRKKDGIFYTPEYITRYIVREAVGGWLDDRKRELGFPELPELGPADFASVKMSKGRPLGNAAAEKHRAAWTAYRDVLADIKVLDPACGSGAFLNQVFDHLSAEGERVNDELARLSLGLRSTEDLSRNILTNNIFGVDINRESVEITKLALWLKTANNQSELKALDHNIRCGNSLIDDPAVAGELAFNWKTEFADIFKGKGGFDVVVGNPPYLRVQGLKEFFENESVYYEKKYTSATGKYDIYVLFIERSYNLMNIAGKVGFILPHKFLISDFGKGIRQFLSNKKAVDKLLHFGSEEVFAEASTYTCLLFLRKSTDILQYAQVKPSTIFDILEFDIASGLLGDSPWVLRTDKESVLDKINKLPRRLSDIFVNISQGVISVGDDIFIFKGKIEKDRFYGYSEKLKKDITLESGIVKKILVGEDVKRYSVVQSTYFVFYPHYEKNGKTIPFEEKDFSVKFPLGYDYISNFKDDLLEKKIRYKTNPKYWYSLHRSREISLFNQEKIITPEISMGSNMTIDTSNYFHNTQVYSLVRSEKAVESLAFLLCILNSSLFWYFLTKTGNVLRGGYFRFKTKFIEPFPIPDTIPYESQMPFIAAADEMLALHRERHTHKKRFCTLLQAELGLATFSRNLENWEALDFKGFAAELAKQKVVLSLGQKSEWLAHFEQERARAQALLEQIRAADRRIDGMVFDLYGLTGEERALVLGAT